MEGFYHSGNPGREGWRQGSSGLHRLLPPLPPPLAKWAKPFDPNDTFESKFFVGKRKSVKVSMMNIDDLTMPYFRDEEIPCTVVEFKYTSNDSALFILPDKGKMEEVEEKLVPETLRRWRDSLQMR